MARRVARPPGPTATWVESAVVEQVRSLVSIGRAEDGLALVEQALAEAEGACARAVLEDERVWAMLEAGRDPEAVGQRIATLAAIDEELDIY